MIQIFMIVDLHRMPYFTTAGHAAKTAHSPCASGRVRIWGLEHQKGIVYLCTKPFTSPYARGVCVCSCYDLVVVVVKGGWQFHREPKGTVSVLNHDLCVIRRVVPPGPAA